MNSNDDRFGAFHSRITSLEEIRDEHQRQLLHLGEFIAKMQDSVLSLVDTIDKQQAMISLLIGEYERTVGALPVGLQQQVDDELAARRGDGQ